MDRLRHMSACNGNVIAIINPAAAAGKTGKRWPRIRRFLNQSVNTCDEVLTEYPGHATELSRQALRDGYGMVIAVGGDGTLNEVAGGFFEGKQALFPDALLGFIPQGTGSDFRRTFGMGTDWVEACERLSGTSSRTIDVGHVRFVDHYGEDAERIFINVASFGCGGAVAKAVESTGKRFGARLSFALTTLRTLLRYRDQPVGVTVDSRDTENLHITNYAVCNAQYFGGGMHVAPQAQVDDGQLNTTIWSGFNLWDFVLKQGQLYRGTHINDARTRTESVRRLHATSADTVLLDVDGENPGRLPASFSIIPAALRLKV